MRKRKEPITYDQTKGEDIIDGLQRAGKMHDPIYIGGKERTQKKRGPLSRLIR